MGLLGGGGGPFSSWKSKRGSRQTVRDDAAAAAASPTLRSPTMLMPSAGEMSDCTTGSTSSDSSSGAKSIEPRSKFLDLPENVRDLVCQLAGTLSQRLEKIATTGSLRAKNVIPIGREILDLSAVCCVVRKMLAGLAPQSIPTEDELHQHISVCQREQCCGCCSVLAMMDIEGVVMKSFPDDLDGSLLPMSVQAAGIAVVISEVEKALKALDSLLYDDGTVILRPPPRRASQTLESMVLQLSSGLRVLFGKLVGKPVFLRMKKTRARMSVGKSEEGKRLGARGKLPITYKNMRSMSARTEYSVATVATG